MTCKTEHAEQVELFSWANKVAYAGFELIDSGIKPPYSDNLRKPVPELRWLHAVPNGGARGDSKLSNQIRGNQLIAEGVKAGVADIFLPVSRHGYHGLYIELKRADRKLSKHGELQKEFAYFVHKQGYAYLLCYGSEEAKEAIRDYLNGKVFVSQYEW